MGNTVSKMLPLERCRNRRDNEGRMLQMSTGHRGILEKLHSFWAAELIHKMNGFLPHYHVIAARFCTARAPLSSTGKLFTAAALRQNGVSRYVHVSFPTPDGVTRAVQATLY